MNRNPEELWFKLALTTPADGRAEFFNRECAENETLHARLNALISAHEEPAAEFADQDASTIKGVTGIPEFNEAVGQILWRYKLLERGGEGGCGVFYVAEQTEPVVRRVAPEGHQAAHGHPAGGGSVQGRAAGAGDVGIPDDFD